MLQIFCIYFFVDILKKVNTIVFNIYYLKGKLMSDFIYDGKLFHNPVEYVLHKIGGTWKMPILWRLSDKVLRYGELKKTLAKVTDKMLATQLRELEKDGFINRVVYPVVPPHTEYSLTDKGKRCIPIIEIIRKYGMELMKEDGIENLS